MKYTHAMLEYVKDMVTIEGVCASENIVFNSSKKADCPICGKKANFTIKNGKYKCWSCNCSGDSIDLYREIYGVNFKDATIALASKFGYCEDGIKLERLKPAIKNEEKVVEDKTLSEEQVNLYHNVYEELALVCGLTQADRHIVEYVRGVRHLKKNDFFSFNVDDMKLGRLIMLCRDKYGYTIEDIAKVPGFYIEDNKLKIKRLYGLGMKARNSKGKVIGIQVRTEFKDSKYLWLSSSNVGGSSCGTPVSVEYPFNAINTSLNNIDELIENSSQTVFITEGKFKGCSINQEFNAIAITLAGINNWRGLVKQELDYIDERKPIKNIMLCFDADMCYNYIIEEQPRKMMTEELNKYMDRNVRVAVWDIRYGKGIDDVISAGFRSKLKSIPVNEFWEKYKAFVDRCEKLGLGKDDKSERTMIFNQIFNL